MRRGLKRIAPWTVNQYYSITALQTWRVKDLRSSRLRNKNGTRIWHVSQRKTRREWDAGENREEVKRQKSPPLPIHTLLLPPPFNACYASLTHTTLSVSLSAKALALITALESSDTRFNGPWTVFLPAQKDLRYLLKTVHCSLALLINLPDLPSCLLWLVDGTCM